MDEWLNFLVKEEPAARPNIRPKTSPADWKDTWYVSSRGINSGPYSTEEVCRKISINELPVDVKLWTLGFKKWVALFEISEFTRVLGILQRRHVRAPFVGAVTIQGLFRKRSATAQTISMGGLGVSGLENFRAGSKVGVVVQSDLLREPIEARGRVIYQFTNKIETSTGIEFTDMDQDGIDVVADYVQQFEQKPAY